jgi:protein required for attachment to host cells
VVKKSRNGGLVMSKDTSRTWALAMNGTRARIVRGLGAGGDTGPAELVLRSDGRRLRAMMETRQGRPASSPNGRRRSALENGYDPVAEDRNDFIRQVIAVLDSHRRADEFDRLAVFAERDTLTNLRHLMPQSLQETVLCEVPRNLLHLSARDLSKTVSDELNNGTALP